MNVAHILKWDRRDVSVPLKSPPGTLRVKTEVHARADNDWIFKFRQEKLREHP